MTTVQNLLDRKGHEVWSVGPSDTVLDAIRQMAERDVGALAVVEDGKLVGMFSERHYARNVFLRGRASPTTQIAEVMETRVAFAQPGQTVEECMAVMTDERVRHLPVLSDGKLTGIISIGDLVKSTIAEQQFTIDQLRHYISG
jgi:CBS domain-containing protein